MPIRSLRSRGAGRGVNSEADAGPNGPARPEGDRGARGITGPGAVAGGIPPPANQVTRRSHTKKRMARHKGAKFLPL